MELIDQKSDILVHFCPKFWSIFRILDNFDHSWAGNYRQKVLPLDHFTFIFQYSTSFYNTHTCLSILNGCDHFNIYKCHCINHMMHIRMKCIIHLLPPRKHVPSNGKTTPLRCTTRYTKPHHDQATEWDFIPNQATVQHSTPNHRSVWYIMPCQAKEQHTNQHHITTARHNMPSQATSWYTIPIHQAMP